MRKKLINFHSKFGITVNSYRLAGLFIMHFGHMSSSWVM